MTTKVLERSVRVLIEDFLVRFRVQISTLLIAALILEDILFWTLPNYGWFDDPSWRGLLGPLLVIAGLGVRSWAAGVLRKGFDLTTEGPYSLCRHPLYFGSFLMMAGFCLVIGYWHDFLVIFGPILLIYLLTMRREERRLAQAYGPRWEAYVAQTPILLPFRPHSYRPGRWTLQQWCKSREYRAAGGGLVALLALEIWRLTC
ncbi:MAG: isoprenylcysteine carboxylmethyltransferase family protein [Planctomycetaceae bacterium]|nr:isoprenylcysteine carboxylmethyltransferase family protein [Planctomycetaceae bacterium]